MRRQQPRNAGINFMHNHLLLGQLPRGGHLSIKDVCHLWIFHEKWQELVTEKTSGFTCCSEVLYVFKENHYISDSTKAKKLN